MAPYHFLMRACAGICDIMFLHDFRMLCIFYVLLSVIAVNGSTGARGALGWDIGGCMSVGAWRRGTHGKNVRKRAGGDRRPRCRRVVVDEVGGRTGGACQGGRSGRMRQPVARLLYRWRDGRRKDRRMRNGGTARARLPGYAPARRARGRRSSASNPPPWRLDRVMSPPCWRAMLRAMDRPRPLPPVWRLRECSTRKNGSNTVST